MNHVCCLLEISLYDMRVRMWSRRNRCGWVWSVRGVMEHPSTHLTPTGEPIVFLARYHMHFSVNRFSASYQNSLGNTIGLFNYKKIILRFTPPPYSEFCSYCPEWSPGVLPLLPRHERLRWHLEGEEVSESSPLLTQQVFIHPSRVSFFYFIEIYNYIYIHTRKKGCTKTSVRCDVIVLLALIFIAARYRWMVSACASSRYQVHFPRRKVGVGTRLSPSKLSENHEIFEFGPPEL